VLIVDDEAAVREITPHTLEAFGYRVLLAAHGGEAVALNTQHSGEIAIVVTDLLMPVMDGVATIRRAGFFSGSASGLAITTGQRDTQDDGIQ